MVLRTARLSDSKGAIGVEAIIGWRHPFKIGGCVIVLASILMVALFIPNWLSQKYTQHQSAHAMVFPLSGVVCEPDHLITVWNDGYLDGAAYLPASGAAAIGGPSHAPKRRYFIGAMTWNTSPLFMHIGKFISLRGQS